MPSIPEGTTQFRLYEDATEYYGIADVTMPEIVTKTTTISGAGIGGDYEAAFVGQIQAMTMNISFRTPTAAAVKLAKPGVHTITMLASVQERDSTLNKIVNKAVKCVCVIQPKKLSPGKFAPASPSDTSGEYAVSRFEQFYDGKQTVLVDPLNMRYTVDGVDYLATVRKHLGY